MTQLCCHYGIRHKTFYKWRCRYKARREVPLALGTAPTNLIVSLRLKSHYGPAAWPFTSRPKASNISVYGIYRVLQSRLAEVKKRRSAPQEAPELCYALPWPASSGGRQASASPTAQESPRTPNT